MLPKYQLEWVKIVDSLLIAYFWASLKFIAVPFHPRPLRLFDFMKISTLDMNFYVVKIFFPPSPLREFCYPPRLLGR